MLLVYVFDRPGQFHFCCKKYFSWYMFSIGQACFISVVKDMFLGPWYMFSIGQACFISVVKDMFLGICFR